MPNATSSMGEQVRFHAGDVIYSQGEESSGVYMILEGQVDLWRHEGENSSHIAALGSGELLGEVSVIEKKQHSVTAKASQLTTALFITADAFRKSFADPLVRHVVHTLATRLRSSYAIKEALEAKSDQPSHYKSTFATIEGLSRMVADRMLTYTEVKDFPFIVGNIASAAGHAVVTDNYLRLPLKNAPELADNHFEIIRRDGQLWVRDLGSAHGTMVNGHKLSKYAMDATARLKLGKNTVTAGGPESPVRLLVTVPPDALKE